MSRIAVTAQFSSAVSFSVFFFSSLFLSLLFDGQSSALSLSLPFLLAEERKKGEMISSNPTAGREEEERRNGMI